MDRRKLEELPFNLVCMRIEQLYAEYETLPSDQESVIDELDRNDNQEMEIDEDGEQLDNFIETVEDESDSSDPDSNIPLSQLRISNNIQESQTIPIWNTNFMGHDIGNFTDFAGVADIVNQVINPTPYKIFSLFITNEMIENIVFQTNTELVVQD